MYISVFYGGQGRREIIFWIWEQKTLRVIAGKKTVRNAVNRGIVRSCKNKLLRRSAWSRMHKFAYFAEFQSILVIPAMFLTSAMCRLSDLRKQPSAAGGRWSISCDRVNINKPKLQNLDRPFAWSSPVKFLTSARCHLFEIRWCGFMATAAAISRGTTVAIGHA